MKNALYITLFILIGGSLGHFGLPWWSLFAVAALAGWLFPLSTPKTFATAFAAGSLLWYGYAFLADTANLGLLSTKVGVLFQGLQSWQLLMVTGFMGGLLAGNGAMTGRLARALFVGEKPKV